MIDTDTILAGVRRSREKQQRPEEVDPPQGVLPCSALPACPYFTGFGFPGSIGKYPQPYFPL
jgi:hypothetical protein